MTKPQKSKPENAGVAARIHAAAERARAEAEARRTAESAPVAREKEIGGPNGPEPTRYGDWERKGLVSDF